MQYVDPSADQIVMISVCEFQPAQAFDQEKNAFVAFVLGFVFGPVGIALYFRNLRDFLVCLGMLLFGAAFSPAGAAIGWFLSGNYGAWRARRLNKRLGLLS